MEKQINDVEEFHSTFHAPVGQGGPQPIAPERVKLRYSLIKEELEEYLEAANKGDLVEVADALGDILYVTFGTIVEHGLQDKMQEVFDEIQRSNMSKLGEDGKPIFRDDGKVLKGPNYFRPDIKKIIES